MLFGRRLLKSEGFSRGGVRKVEELLMTCSSFDMFASRISEEEMSLNAEKVSLVWDLYKFV